MFLSAFRDKTLAKGKVEQQVEKKFLTCFWSSGNKKIIMPHHFNKKSKEGKLIQMGSTLLRIGKREKSGSRNSHEMTSHSLGNILLSDCRSLKEEFDAVSTKYIYREANRCADRCIDK